MTRAAGIDVGGTKFLGVKITPPEHKEDGGDYVYFSLDIPDSYFTSKDFTEHNVARFGSEFMQALMDEGFAGHFMMVRDPKTGEIVSIDSLFPVEEVKPWQPEPDLESIAMSTKAGLPAVRNLKALAPLGSEPSRRARDLMSGERRTGDAAAQRTKKPACLHRRVQTVSQG